MRKLRAFLCHASGDKEVVKRLYHRLVGDGIDAWLDEEKLLPGQNWKTAIADAISATDVVIVCLSVGSITKEGVVQQEISWALDVAEQKPENTIFIIPLRLEPCAPPRRLSRWHWVDYHSPSGYERLLKALNSRSPRHLPQPIDRTPDEWLRMSFISDRTEFSTHLHEVAALVGFNDVTDSQDERFGTEHMAVLVRGQHYSDIRVKKFYSRAASFVRDGGLLVATAWASWETIAIQDFCSVLPLPFTHPKREYRENATLEIRATEEALRSGICSAGRDPFHVNLSYEILERREGSSVLLESRGVPIWGYRRTEHGLCYYLNACQHLSNGYVPSPLSSPILKDAIRQTLDVEALRIKHELRTVGSLL